MNRTAVIAGATGLIGLDCLEILLGDDAYAHVVAVLRRPLDQRHGKLEQAVVVFESLMEHPVRRCDAAICALGTTIRAAGSREAFRRVDFDAVVTFARWAKAAGAQSFAFVSSVGADPCSSNFYLRTKGEAEEALRGIGFRDLHLFRPSLLLGHRREFRLGEALGAPLARAVAPLLLGSARNYRPIAAHTVARALARAAATPSPGTHVHHWSEILALARDTS